MKNFELLINEVIKKKPKVVGVYRLIDGLEFKNSNMEYVLSTLKNSGIDIVIYEPISNIIFVNKEDNKLDDIKKFVKI